MKWAARPTEPLRTAIVICTCGAKYIKTREGQVVCVRCLLKVRDSK
jgi:hypothetical protein